MGETCAVVALAILFVAAEVQCQSQSCGLKVTPAEAVRVRPGHDITLVCDASCLGPLSRDQLQWRDPRGGRIPAQAAGVRLFAVTYNRWMLSRLVLLNPQLGDSGVYTCELRHDGRHLQYAAVVQVEDDTVVDLGPRRGDIYIEPDPDFTNTRPVRSVSSDLEHDSFHYHYEGVSDPRDSPDDNEPSDDADLQADADDKTELHDNANSHPGIKDVLTDNNPAFTPNGRNLASRELQSVMKELRGEAGLEDLKSQTRFRRSLNDNTSLGLPNNNVTEGLTVSTNGASDMPENSTYLTTLVSSGASLLSDGSIVNNSTTSMSPGDMFSATERQTDRPMNDNNTSSINASSTGGANSTTLAVTTSPSGANSTTTVFTTSPGDANSTTPAVTMSPGSADSTTSPATRTPNPATTTPAATTAQPTRKIPTKYTTNHPDVTSRPSKSKSDGNTDPDFGRYGVVAFALALSAAFLLLVALLLVLLCPRYIGGRSQKHTINTPEGEPGGRGGGARAGPRGDGDGVFLMGAMPSQKKLTPMASATGLNGEYHTAIDLDSDDPNKAKAQAGQGHQGAKKDAAAPAAAAVAEGGKKEEEAKTQESFVSTFLIGRLSSSKQTEGEQLGDTSAAEGEEDVFKSAPAGANNPVTDSKAKGEKEKDGSSSSGASSSSSPSSSDSDEEEIGKKEGSDGGKDARPESTGSVTGMMPNIKIEFKETNMDEV